jgi:hypothetical protein
MPQPLTKIRPGPYTLDFSPGAEKKAPKAALLALNAINVAAKADADFARFVATFTHGRVETVMEFYLSLRNDAPKIAVVEALAAAALPRERLALFKALTRLYQIAIKDRQPLAHWLYGHCAEIPDALLLADPRDWLAEQALIDPVNARAREAAVQRMQFPEKFKAAIDQARAEVFEIQRSRQQLIQVYRENDLSSIGDSIWRASERLCEFHMVIAWDAVDKTQGDIEALKLSQRPEIASLLAAQAVAAKGTG